jgi:hypothetical protein
MWNLGLLMTYLVVINSCTILIAYEFVAKMTKFHMHISFSWCVLEKKSEVPHRINMTLDKSL